MSETTKSIVIVGPVRLAYMSVFSPRENRFDPSAEPKFEATLLIPKGKTPQQPDGRSVHAQIVETIKAVAADKFGKATYKVPLQDGDKAEEGSEPKHPGYWFMKATAKSEYPPALVDGAGEIVTKSDGWQSGDWGRVKIAFYTTEHGGIKRVNAGLRAVQFTHKDEPFGGPSGPEDPGRVASEFGKVDGYEKPTAPASTDGYDPFADGA